MLERSGVRPPLHAGKSAGADPRAHAARRAVPGLRGRALRDRDRHPAARGPPAGAPLPAARTAITASSPRWCSSRATATTPRRARRSSASCSRSSTAPRSSSRSRSRSRSSRASTSWCRCPGVPDGRSGCSPAAGRRRGDRAPHRRRGARLARRARARAPRAVRRRARLGAGAALRRGVPGRLPRRLRPARRGLRHRAHGRARGAAGSGALGLPPARGAVVAAAPQALPPRADLPLRDAADPREHGPQGHRRAPLRACAATTARRSTSTTSTPSTPARRTSTCASIEPAFRDTLMQVWQGTAENDGFNRLVLGARLAPRQVTVLRAACKYLLQARVAWSQTYMEQTLAASPMIARLLVELFEARFDPALEASRATRGRAHRRRHPRRARSGAEPRRRPHPARVPGLDRGGAAHQLLPARRRRRAAPLPVDQARSAPARVPAAAAPALRDLRLLAAGRGRPPARRQGRARRHPLLRPSRGLPHRDPRA